MKAEAARRFKEFGKKNHRLKKIVADQALDIDMLKELSRGSFRARSAEERLFGCVRSASG